MTEQAETAAKVPSGRVCSAQFHPDDALLPSLKLITKTMIARTVIRLGEENAGGE